jgi:hypothetical protein
MATRGKVGLPTKTKPETAMTEPVQDIASMLIAQTHALILLVRLLEQQGALETGLFDKRLTSLADNAPDPFVAEALLNILLGLRKA